CQQYYTDPYNF
nr:immunoglobulin light chain junction region [Macaca mulatta]MOY12911.1 immunoglobulin light chain junction region [Macaca mulatta]MOY13000.1 immunoglobulin light chain junction region [Macaca mulatta]MOY14506.1 immunoglobulin light chain junction region [Macaca mulatta]